MTTTTGHTLTIDRDAGLLEIEGDLDTMSEIPEAEINAACASAGVRCTWEPTGPTAYRVAPLRSFRVVSSAGIEVAS